MDVVLTAAGVSSDIVEVCRDAAHRCGGRLLVAEHDELAPSRFLADEVIRVPTARHRDYVACLLDALDPSRPSILLPLTDDVLPPLARAGEELRAAGCTPVVSSAAAIEVADDKLACIDAVSAAGIRVPRSWPGDVAVDERLPAEVFVRPRRGAGSRDARAITLGELAAAERRDTLIVQEIVRNPEVTIDVLLDLTGEAIAYVPRLRVRTEAGRSMQAITVRHAAIDRFVDRLRPVLRELGCRGPVSVQAFMTAPELTFCELNPRLASGATLAIAAGVPIVDLLVDMACGRPVAPRWGEYEVGLAMTRSLQAAFVRASG